MTARVLVVDDDDDIRAIVKTTLELASHEVLLASDGVEGLDVARSERPDVIVLDVMMPRMDGLQALRELRTDASISHLPVLMLTARSQSDDVVEALRAGADDYITKPFDLDELSARIDAVIRRASQQRALNPLTGLPGNERILVELSRRVDSGEATALLYVDIDGFKPYNDHYGFMRGDEVLRMLAELLSELCRGREEAFVGHVGGDDFVMVTRPDDAGELAAAACSGFDERVVALYDPSDRESDGIAIPDRSGVVRRFGFLSISIGVATNAGRPAEHVAQLVTAATEMKQYAKQRDDESSRFAVDRRSPSRSFPA